MNRFAILIKGLDGQAEDIQMFLSLLRSEIQKIQYESSTQHNGIVWNGQRIIMTDKFIDLQFNKCFTSKPWDWLDLPF